MRSLFKFLAIICILGSLAFLDCQKKSSPANANLLPNTTLANIPVDGDTIFALATMHWDGEDDDGFISGYRYRYITTHLTNGDSVVKPWIDTKETSVTIPFESSDVLNFQKFQVQAVDNNGDADNTPAEKRFYTVQTVFPQTNILSPTPNQKFFAIDQTTDWWQGIRIIFNATDQDGAVVEYAWAVDDGEWNWGPDTLVYVDPEFFDPLAGKHTLRVTSRDNTNLVDPVGDSVVVDLLQPSFDKLLLIVDETDESLFPTGINEIYHDADVDSFYSRIFPQHDSWDFLDDGMPPKETLGQYKLILWHADNSYTNELNVHKLPQHIADIMDYLNVGGNFIMSGWRILKSFAQAEPFPKTFEEGTFIHDYLHILTADETSSFPDFDRILIYSQNQVVDTLFVDQQKLSVFPWSGKMGLINVISRRGGFTDAFYGYGNDDQTGLPTYRNAVIGLRYYGTSFNAIVLGFPMFFVREDDAAAMAADMMNSLGF
jgi:hypothetical protein